MSGLSADTTAPLAAHDLLKRYGAVAALASISVEIPAGSVTALVGPNGAGKSTLLRSWIGFERPTSGSVAVWGKDPWRSRSETLPRLAYVPQRPALYGSLSVADHLSIAAHYRPAFQLDEAVRRLDRLGISRLGRARNLSGGQAAQLGLAIALGTTADTLVLDEPLASLDPLARREFLDMLLDGVRPAGRTVVLSSHVISDIAHACDRIVVLALGRKMLDAPIAEVLATHHVVDGRVDEAEPGFVGPVGTGAGLSRVVHRGGLVPGSRVATLEDVVLAYLVAGRPKSTEDQP